MNEIKHTPLIADNERVRLEDGTLIATVWVQYPEKTRLAGESWMDMMERLQPAKRAAEALAIRRAKEFAAASDAILALELLAAEADAGTVMIPSALRLTIDAALIKAGRKAAPTAVRHVTIAGDAR
ncbi:hypothetical protein NX868_10410 [Burkholderia thailandensis]|uniref:hypothetical protein n=1 Tax=Burkholderia thailandensis TaxID=57975 RepID=UPI00217D26B9|nr:hypothetical protein [Burkholderia thailandensis]MCS6455974.1 hypothetical protein [Burkholderia thailandensis]MCS6482689.1 hypothetical protein [Burkholderia thailandensis]